MLITTQRTISNFYRNMEVFEPSLHLANIHLYDTKLLLNYKNYLNLLPRELLLAILFYLNKLDLFNLSLVNKYFNKLIYDGTLWCTLDLSNELQFMPSSIFSKIIREASSYIKVLRLRNYNNITESVMNCLISNCFNLEVIDIAGCNRIRQSQLVQLLKNNTKLQHLNLNGLNKMDLELQKLIQTKQLMKLNLSYCKIHQLSQLSESLICLNLSGLANITDELLEHLQNLDALKKLNLNNNTYLTDNHLQLLFNKKTRFKLSHLSLKYLNQLQFCFNNIINYQTELIHLDLTDTKIAYNLLNQLVIKLVHLQYFSLDGITYCDDNIIQQLVNYQTQLDTLLLNNINLEDITIQRLKNIKLKRLEINNNKRVTNQLLLNLPITLCYLDVLDCPNLTRDAIYILPFYYPKLKINSVFDKLTNSNHEYSMFSCILL